MDHRPPTLGPLLTAIVHDIRAVLGNDVVGIYLYGSAVSGGFDPGVSDLDLLVVTSTEVEGIDLAGLERMHADFVQRHPDWTDRIEIVYIGQATLRSFRTSTGSLAVISPGEPFHVTGPVLDWDQNWYLVRETGAVLYGVPAVEMIPPISQLEYVAAVARYAAWLGARTYADLSPGSLAYAVLALCRARQTVRTGVRCSKQDGAMSTLEEMPDWAGLIEAALTCRLSRGTIGFDDEPTRRAAGSFIRLVADQISGAAST